MPEKCENPDQDPHCFFHPHDEIIIIGNCITGLSEVVKAFSTQKEPSVHLKDHMHWRSSHNTVTHVSNENSKHSREVVHVQGRSPNRVSDIP